MTITIQNKYTIELLNVLDAPVPRREVLNDLRCPTHEILARGYGVSVMAGDLSSHVLFKINVTSL